MDRSITAAIRLTSIGHPNFDDPIWGINTERDGLELAARKRRLYEAPAPASELSEEITFICSTLPAHLHNHPVVPLAANGLYIVRSLMGTFDEFTLYNGSHESNVPAGFHNTLHTGNGIQAIIKHVSLAKSAYTDEELLAAILAYSYHDAIQGNARYTTNREAYDEKMSSLLLEYHARLRQQEYPEITDFIIEGAQAGIGATRFNKQLMRQNVNLEPTNPFRNIEIATGGVDLVSLALASGPSQAMGLLVEDLSLEHTPYGNVFGQLLSELKTFPDIAIVPQLSSTHEALALIDNYRHFTFTAHNQTKTLKEWALFHMHNSSTYMIEHEFPQGWLLDDPLTRQANSLIMEHLITRIRTREVTFAQAFQLTEAYAKKPR